MDDAERIFGGIIDKNVVIWSGMIASHAIHGQEREALEAFYLVIHCSDGKPNNVTFLSILFACSYSGLIEEGIKVFDIMVHDFQLDLNLEHYGITVDLLATGETEPYVWGALLGACRIHHNVKIGELVAKDPFHLDPKNDAYYTSL
ncbi:hypothetical protein CISIN_1g047113mg [Citrus sinensis]|uniref:Pentatricopeptide repeat-containing protein n=1 Tax=Citrus sinensis TaxID=2711 RepID=A0A067DNS1_CITSI|nr:hypothetical protein CISIN_1g047113mg [Citrus sinensis]